jgi:hypothetical protein
MPDKTPEQERHEEIVRGMAYHYLHETGVPEGEVITVHSEMVRPGILCLSIGVGQEAAAAMTVAHIASMRMDVDVTTDRDKPEIRRILL